MQKIFLLDAFALIYRSHYAFINSPRRSSKGLDTGAIFGFTNTLLEVLKKENPTHIAVAFDTPEPTFRHKEFIEYKAQRQEQPEGITAAIPYIFKLLEAFRVPIVMKAGYEADDVIGTIAKKLANVHAQVFMMTPDKDYCQLLDENIFIFRPATRFAPNEVWDTQKALDKFGVKYAMQVTDILGLQGDAVDNIPGIPGIGEKTAQKLIAEYETVENLIANADKLSGKIKENVINFAEKGILSKRLATIDINVPIEHTIDDFLVKDFDKEKLTQLFEELEFSTLRKKILGETQEEKQAKKTFKTLQNNTQTNENAQLNMFGNSQSEQLNTYKKNAEDYNFQDDTEPSYTTNLRNISNTLHKYSLIDTPALRRQLVGFLKLQKEFCFDTETTSLNVMQAEIVGLSVSYYAAEAYYVPFGDDREQTQMILEEFREVFEDENISKIGQNLKYDMAVLQNYHIQVKGQCFDTMLAHYLIDSESRHNMDILAEKYLHYQPVSIETLIGKKGINQGNMRDVAVEKVVEYAGEDADVTWQLKQQFAPLLQQANLKKLFYDIEMPLIEVLAQMEKEGIRIDINALAESSKELEQGIKILEEEIYRQAGEKFNIASPKQLGEVLFDKMKLLKDAKKTKTGQYATGEEVLSKLAGEHKIAQDLLEIRELQKLKSTYIDALPLLVDKQGRVHTSYNQAVTTTGRLSSTNPNLQNIPIKTQKGREIRKAFIPKNDQFVILSADYSQIELRLMAAFSQDETMLEAFEKGLDIHAITAGRIYKVEVEDVTSDMRRNAKTANFSILYGSSAFGLAEKLKMSRSEASQLIDAYYKEFPAIKLYKDSIIQKAREHEFVETHWGRKRYLREINSRNQTMRGHSERNAVNTPIQGTAADMIKVAMIKIHHFIKQENLQSRMILQVHDELVFDAHISEVEFLKKNVIKLMQNALPLPVRIEVEAGTGQNWLEAH